MIHHLVLAGFLFGNNDALIRIDMSEYMERFSVSRLIGAPPGYVGYDEAGELTEAVRRRPYTIVLFDEIEKAHRDVFNILLQVMDDGILTDAQGRHVDFRNTVLIMTSNLGSKAITDRASLGFGVGDLDRTESYKEMKSRVMSEVKELFRPEFVNRLDDIIVFRPLEQEDIRNVADLMIGELQQRLQERDRLPLPARGEHEEVGGLKGLAESRSSTRGHEEDTPCEAEPLHELPEAASAALPVGPDQGEMPAGCALHDTHENVQPLVRNVKPGAGRVLGLLSVVDLPKRLTLDFRDVTEEGLAFDTVKGDFKLVAGNAYTDNLLLKGTAVDIGVAGRTGLATEDYDQRVVVSGNLSGPLTVAGALAAGPVIGAGVLVLSQLFKGQLQGLTRVYYRVTGPWSNPAVEKISAATGEDLVSESKQQ